EMGDLLLLDPEFKQDNPWERRSKKPVCMETARAILEVLRRRNPQLPAELGITDEIPADIKWDVFTALLNVITDRAGLLADLQSAGIAVQSLDPEFVEKLRGY